MPWSLQGAPSSRPFILVIDQDPPSSSVEIFELAVSHRPEEECKTQRPHAKRDRDQESQDAHCVNRARRNELATTTTELSDMAMAAIMGVTNPASANGTARAL